MSAWRSICAACHVVRTKKMASSHRPSIGIFGTALAHGVPPWERDRLPLIYAGERLAAVVGLWICRGFEAEPGGPGWSIHWIPHAPDRLVNAERTRSAPPSSTSASPVAPLTFSAWEHEKDINISP